MARRTDITRVPEDQLANEIVRAWGVADDDLIDARANYWLNLAFYLGHQWIWWDRERKTVQALRGRQKDSDRVMARMNRIRPRINSLRGRLTKRPLHFEVRPTAADDATLVAAKTAEQLVEYRRVGDGWEELRTDNIFSLLMGATTLALPQWDESCKEVKVDSFNIAEFTLEPGTRRPRDARWMIVARAVPPEYARDTYKMDHTPEPSGHGESSPLHRSLISASAGGLGVSDRVTVYHYFERPTNESKGRTAVVVENELVEHNDWPYPFEHLPGYVFRCDQIPQRWHGDTPMNDARPIQAAYNLIRSTTLENAKKASASKLLIPLGSLRDEDELDDEPGAHVHYLPDANGGKPDWLTAPNLPRDLRYECDRLERELDDTLMTHAVARGEAPGDRNSGLALSILSENDDTPLGTMVKDQQQGWGMIASQMLKIYADRVKQKRTARVTDASGEVPVTIEWTGKMIAGQDDVHVPLDAVLPHSRAATQSMMVELKQAFPEHFQGLPPEVFFRLMDIGSIDQLREAMDDDVACAVYENTMLMQGEVELPEPWHDHARHIAEHNRERNSRRYRLATEDVRETMDDHIRAHEMMIREEAEKTMRANEVLPGLGALPDGDESLGALVPKDHIDAGQPMSPTMPAGPPPPMI